LQVDIFVLDLTRGVPISIEPGLRRQLALYFFGRAHTKLPGGITIRLRNERVLRGDDAAVPMTAPFKSWRRMPMRQRDSMVPVQHGGVADGNVSPKSAAIRLSSREHRTILHMVRAPMRT